MKMNNFSTQKSFSTILEQIKWATKKHKIEPFLAWFKIGVYIAMQEMVNPSLRCIALNWEHINQKTSVTFFFMMETSLETLSKMTIPVLKRKQHVQLQKTILATTWVLISKCIPLPFPKPIPKVSEVVYLRKEPGFEFNEINRYIPDWACTSIIRLKINEALRGKVTPDLRQIQFRWTKPEKEALVTYIHNAPVTPEVEAHYKEIFEIATAVPWRHEEGVVAPHMEVVSIPYPQTLPNKSPKKNFYTRREPFEDPKDKYE